MILAATGHEAVDRFLETKDPQIKRIAHWDQMSEWISQATHVVLSDRIPGFPEWDEVRHMVVENPQPHWMIWLPERMRETTEPPLGAELVFGDLAADWLVGWLEKEWPRESANLVLSKRWVVWRPQLDFNPEILSWIGSEANRQLGVGCWVDLDWHNAHLTARWNPEAWKNSNMTYAKFKARKTSEGWLVPAPPPWQIVCESPQLTDIQGLMRRDYAWLGLDLGSDLRLPLTMQAIEAVQQVVILIDEPWDRVLQEGLKVLQTINPSLGVLGIGGSATVARTIGHVGTWIPWESAAMGSRAHRIFGRWSLIKTHRS